MKMMIPGLIVGLLLAVAAGRAAAASNGMKTYVRSAKGQLSGKTFGQAVAACARHHGRTRNANCWGNDVGDSAPEAAMLETFQQVAQEAKSNGMNTYVHSVQGQLSGKTFGQSVAACARHHGRTRSADCGASDTGDSGIDSGSDSPFPLDMASYDGALVASQSAKQAAQQARQAAQQAKQAALQARQAARDQVKAASQAARSAAKAAKDAAKHSKGHS